VRLATFNVLHGRAPADGRVDLDRFAAAVRTLDADVLALQEVDRAQPRSGSADLTAVAAQAGGYASARFVPALHGEPGSWRPAVGDLDGAPAYGVALLSRLPVLSERTVHLPALRVPVPVVFSGRRRVQVVRDEPRVAAVARLATEDGELTVVSTHLSFLAGWNLLQLRRLVHGLAGERRLVVAGDFNLPPDAVVRASRLRPLAAGATFPAHEPVRQIDHLMARGAVSGTGARVWDLPLSDHRALSVELGPSGTDAR
jgi:endonuclease/exonuclease/phosphatase family metal-dependent hydrolase